MIANCEQCGKRYRIDPKIIKGKTARFRCRVCNSIITVSKPEVKSMGPPPSLRIEKPAAGISEERPHAVHKEKKIVSEKKGLKTGIRKPRRLGLRTKMMVLFFIIPIVLMTIASQLYIRQLDSLYLLITKDYSRVVTQFAEKAIAEKARSVAVQVKQYLESYPYLEKQAFDSDVDFKAVCVQNVGSTGYTALHAVPDENGIWRNWAHVNPKIVGLDMSTLKKPMGKAFARFWKIFSAGKDGKESKGYYTWQDKDGIFRDKFMVCTPVKGTHYVVAATTYLDEFTLPAKIIEKHAEEFKVNTNKMIITILACTLILVGLVVFFYAYKITKRIKYLSQVAERISIGELDAEIEVRSKDEIGALAEAISRMQDSIGLSIERLRRRR